MAKKLGGGRKLLFSHLVFLYADDTNLNFLAKTIDELET